ncbi:Signal transduction histidine kinase [Desulfatibacillum alkenivorans DSM 16219]|jgi:signal transduction histidine kinase|uniref:histidine kinase n=1 Tax=Desulfatibacillum alkenivorans DSM 16219 TaxID=1121393 RepID=A0A1M6XKV2_9BACT|nr:ATP-binding protein [Desulfatibacillum alkenivorans]SHL06597.1 Signal transduction histidine kinase [Desulfatibacillum alkenivorans DSM 16219]
MSNKDEQASYDAVIAPSSRSVADSIMAIEKALSERPKLSIRFRITMAFTIAFLFSFAIAISSIVFISRLNVNQEHLDRVGALVFNIEQARRHEKNFFLYGAKTDIFDALASIQLATEAFHGKAQGIRPLVSEDIFTQVEAELKEYSALLTEISHAPAMSTAQEDGDKGLEARVRVAGHQVMTHATNLMNQAHLKVRAMAHMFMVAAIFIIILNLIVMIWVATEMARQILQPLGRFVGYAERIGAGDFRPVTPQRKYRDEFSNLAIAINSMVRELLEKHEELLQSRKMAAVGTLTSGIAHELNNPLNNISLTTETLLEGMEDYTREEALEMLRDIFVQVERASGTVKNLLDFTRKDQARFEPVDLGEVVESSFQLVENECSLNEVETQNLIDIGLPKARANFRNLQQVLLNMFLNAIHAMPQGGRIDVESHLEGDWLKMDIADTGSGIEKKNLERIFDPFFTTKEVGRGTGLGLSVSYGIIEKMGGRITVASEEGEGTTFSIFLPVWREEDLDHDAHEQ